MPAECFLDTQRFGQCGATSTRLTKAAKRWRHSRVKNAANEDWEDIAAYKDRGGDCFLYIGDIGNNARTRGDFVIYRVREPEIPANGEESKAGAEDTHDLAVLRRGRRLNSTAETEPRTKIFETDTAEAIKFDYPDMRHDAETLMVNPQTADIYIVSKRLSGAAAVYKLAANEITNKINRLEKISDIVVPALPNGFITGGDIAPDGRRVVLCDYFAAYEFILPAKSKNFDDIWKVAPQKIELGERAQGEAVGYSADGNSIFATSEKADSPLIEVKLDKAKNETFKK